MTYLVYDRPLAFVVHQEAVLSRIVPLPVVEVCSHLERDLSSLTISHVELAEVAQFARGDEEVVFGISCNDRLEACYVSKGGCKDSPSLVLVYATW